VRALARRHGHLTFPEIFALTLCARYPTFYPSVWLQLSNSCRPPRRTFFPSCNCTTCNNSACILDFFAIIILVTFHRPRSLLCNITYTIIVAYTLGTYHTLATIHNETLIRSSIRGIWFGLSTKSCARPVYTISARFGPIHKILRQPAANTEELQVTIRTHPILTLSASLFVRRSGVTNAGGGRLGG
jgi:hypothetical protein